MNTLSDILRDDILAQAKRGVIDCVPVPHDPHQRSTDVMGDVLPDSGETLILGGEWNDIGINLHDDDDVKFCIDSPDGLEHQVTVDDLVWTPQGIRVAWTTEPI